MTEKKITPGERAINWAKAAAILVPLFGVGVFAGNTETVHKWLAAPDEVLPVEVDQSQYNAKINAKFLELEEAIERLEAESERDNGKINTRLQLQINANKKLISKWHDE